MTCIKRGGLGSSALVPLLLGSFVGLGSACSDDTPIADIDSSPSSPSSPNSPPGSPSELDPPSGSAAPTYYADVAPIFSAKCVGCHQEGGIAPFALNDYEAARDHGTMIADYTRDRVMPPFGIDTGGDCGSFDDDVTLTDAEIELIGEWGRGERAEGTPVELIVPALPALADGTDFPLPEFTPVIQGTELALFDEYRCFLLDPNETPGFVTGYDVLPGNAALVHHVLGFIVDPARVTEDGRTNAQVMDQLHADDPNPERDGWSCFGMAGDGVNVESVPVTWGPGQGVVNYPDGVGVPFTQGQQLVVQVHYNMAGNVVAGEKDKTTLRMHLAPTVERRAVFVLEDPLLGSLYRGSPTLLEPGQPSVKYTWTQSGAEMGLPPGLNAELMSLIPHMHGRGRKYTFEVASDGGDFACQGRVNSWDFNWQRVYDYREPLPFNADTRVRVTCDYDTRQDDQPVIPGWGTRNEMCLATMVLALPPGL